MKKIEILGGWTVLAVLVLGLAACGGDGNSSGGGNSSGTLSFSSATYSVTEGTPTVTITVNRSGGSTGAVTVAYATGGGNATAGSDYTAASGTLSWAAGDVAAKTFAISITNDASVETAETVNLTLSGAAGGASLGTAAAVLTIADNDVATLSGVAASGAALVGATVTLKDANGVQRTSTTNASGQYSLDTIGLTPPFLVRVESGGITLFSEGLVAGSIGSPATVNVHPFTNLLLQIYYQGQGLSAATVFGGAGAPSALPSADALQNLANIVLGIIKPVLDQAGVDSATFNLVTATLTANGTGFDGVLDDTAFLANGIDFTINNGTVTQAVDVNVDADGNSTPGDVSLTTTTTDNSNQESSQSSQQTTVAPAAQQSDFDASIAGVRTTFANVASTAAQKGANLTAEDMLQYIDAQFLQEGQDGNGFAEDLVGFFTQEIPANSTVTVDDVSVRNFVEADAADIVAVIIRIRIAPPQDAATTQDLGGGEDSNTGIQFRRQANGSFLFYGDQNRFKARVQAQFSRDYQINGDQLGAVVDARRISAQSSNGPGTMSAISVSNDAGQLPACSGGAEAQNQDYGAVHVVGDTFTLNLEKRSALTNGEERFDLPCSYGFPRVDVYPPAGTVYQLSITPTGQSTVMQTSRLNASTDETFDILTINEMDRATFAAAQHNNGAGLAGQTLIVTWNKPITLPIQDVQLRLFVQNADGDGNDVEIGNLSPSATSGQITVPQTVNGKALTNLNVTVAYTGTSGERTQSNQLFPN